MIKEKESVEFRRAAALILRAIGDEPDGTYTLVGALARALNTGFVVELTLRDTAKAVGDLKVDGEVV